MFIDPSSGTAPSAGGSLAGSFPFSQSSFSQSFSSQSFSSKRTVLQPNLPRLVKAVAEGCRSVLPSHELVEQSLNNMIVAEKEANRHSQGVAQAEAAVKSTLADVRQCGQILAATKLEDTVSSLQALCEKFAAAVNSKHWATAPEDPMAVARYKAGQKRLLEEPAPACTPSVAPAPS
jgi:hypothetical protein